MSDPFDRLINRGTRTSSVTLALDPNDAERLAEARAKARRTANALERLMANGTPSAISEAEEEHRLAEEALAAVLDEVVTFTVNLRGVGPRRVEELMLDHRPTQQQQQRAKKLSGGDPKAQPSFDEEAFPPALLAEAITSIEFSDGATIAAPVSVERLTELWMGRWSQGDKALLLQTAMLLDQAQSAVGDLGKG